MTAFQSFARALQGRSDFPNNQIVRKTFGGWTEVFQHVMNGRQVARSHVLIILFACTARGQPLHWRFGAWLSLVERLVRDQEAGGSNPLAPTKYS